MGYADTCTGYAERFEIRNPGRKSNIWDKYWNNTNNHEWWERPAPEVIAFIESQSPESHPAVLDLGCGLGRHAIAFALYGFRVTATAVKTKPTVILE
jgi:2-polyprenyl-3-methyl-5-hydroxy-6-metoxy-1,4-benzoquinol methylase